MMLATLSFSSILLLCLTALVVTDRLFSMPGLFCVVIFTLLFLLRGRWLDIGLTNRITDDRTARLPRPVKKTKLIHGFMKQNQSNYKPPFSLKDLGTYILRNNASADDYQQDQISMKHGCSISSGRNNSGFSRKSRKDSKPSNKYCTAGSLSRCGANKDTCVINSTAKKTNISGAGLAVPKSVEVSVSNKKKVVPSAQHSNIFSGVRTVTYDSFNKNCSWGVHYKFSKLCAVEGCDMVMISFTNISTNICRFCKPKKGKEIEFYRFITRRERGKTLEYFCGCDECQDMGITGCEKTLCYLCTQPKSVFGKLFVSDESD